MKRAILALAVLSSGVLSAQTADTTLFRAALHPLTSAAGDSGAADILVHTVRDSSNHIVSGSVDFLITYQFPADQQVTGLGIADSQGIAIAGPINSASPVSATAGAGRLQGQTQVTSGDLRGLAVLTGLFSNAPAYPVNVLTKESSGTAMTGLLEAGSIAVFMAAVQSSAGSGVATVRVFYTGPAYGIGSAEVWMQLSYQFSAQATFSGMRVYSGQGESGQIAVSALVAPGTLSAASGSGMLTVPPTEIDMNNAQMVQNVQGILLGATSFSVDVNTVEQPTAPLTGQLRGTDSMVFQIPNPQETNAAWAVRLNTLRSSSGQITAATVIFDMNYRTTAGAEFTLVELDTSIVAPAVTTDPSGSGNFYVVVTVSDTGALSTLNDIVKDPENHVLGVALQNPANSYTAALATPNPAAPVVAAVIPIVEVKNLTTFAPGELVEIYGTNLAKVTTDLSGWPGVSLPSQLNGVSVSVAGQTARILYVSSIQVDVELPFETPNGAQSLTLNNGNSASAPISLNVATMAPAIYNFAFQNANFSFLSSNNPAKAGDVLVFYTTGMGQTNPLLATGQIVPAGPPFYDTAPVTVTIGGVGATLVYSIGAPPYVAGLYQMAVTVPAGLGQGSVPVVASAGGISSNTVMIAVH